jgi:hypothetical protein
MLGIVVLFIANLFDRAFLTAAVELEVSGFRCSTFSPFPDDLHWDMDELEDPWALFGGTLSLDLDTFSLKAFASP